MIALVFIFTQKIWLCICLKFSFLTVNEIYELCKGIMLKMHFLFLFCN